MYEVVLRNNKTDEIFKKVFWSEKEMKTFVNKVKRGKKLTLLTTINNSYLYDQGLKLILTRVIIKKIGGVL